MKIGYTAGVVRNRVQTLSTRKRRVYLVRAVELPRAVALKAEKGAHRALALRRRRTHYGSEWFDVPPALASRRVNEAAKAASKRLGFAVDQFVMWHVVRDMKRAAGEPNATGASGRPFRKATKR